MQRSDYLNPSDIKNQCMQAVSRMEEDRQILKTVSTSIENFAKDREIESESFEALKQQLKDYTVLIEAMQIANETDITDFRSLSNLVGGELLDGETIFSQMENALKMKESYLASEELYRRKMKLTEDAFLRVYYHWKAQQYISLAENSQRLYDKWREKTEKYDEIAAGTGHLFMDSEGISAWIQKGFSEISG